jgi:hypothetical protein
MSGDWVSQAGTTITAVAGIAATYLTARFSSRSGLDALERAHHQKVIDTRADERKSAYCRMLYALEKFDHTLSLLARVDQQELRAANEQGSTVTFTPLSDNLETDLEIQRIERELELIAPLGVLKACRGAFAALREQTHNLMDNHAIDNGPFMEALTIVITEMRSDLDEREAIEAPLELDQDAVDSIFEMLAPESAFFKEGIPYSRIPYGRGLPVR